MVSIVKLGFAAAYSLDIASHGLNDGPPEENSLIRRAERE